MRYLFFLTLISVSIFSTSSYAMDSSSITKESLRICASNYRDGYYGRAVECINLVLPSLTTFSDSVESYKMLALSYGMINQIELSKKYFNIALEKDSLVDIDTLAFPPNIALIYNQVKLEKRMSRIEKTRLPLTPPPPRTPTPVVIPEKKHGAVAALLLSSVVLSAGGAAYLYYNGYLAYNDYSDLKTDQALMDKKWNEYTYSIAGGAGCTLVCGVVTVFFLRLLNRHESSVSVSGLNNGVAMVYKF